MKRKLFIILLLSSMLFSACNTTAETPKLTIAPTITSVPTPEPTIAPTEEPTPAITPETQDMESSRSKRDNIPFTDDQLYAVAYLGYINIEDMDYYLENYVDEENVPHYYFSGDEFYLIIPRYEEMEIRLYRNDLATMGKTLEQECEAGRPFTLQCNVSDIFPDVTVELIYNGETVEFSPYISLKDGSVQVGEMGLNITRPLETFEPDLQEPSQSGETSESPEEGWVSLSEEEIRWFNEAFFNADDDFRKNNFLNCTYAEVKDINLYDIFYNSSEEISKEERNALRGSEIDFGTDFFKLTIAYMDKVLMGNMRISFEETEKVGLENYLYFEEFDAYFNCHGDTNYSPIEVISGVKDEGGNVRLRYLRREEGKEYIVTLEHYGEGYCFVSNVETE